MKIVIIGAGSVGTNLHHALELKGIKAELVHARPLTADPSEVEKIPQGDCYIYPVADHVLKEIVSLVHAPKALHLHTSGTMPIEVFGEDKPHAGIMYFLQSFSKTALIDDWSRIPCFVEGRNIDDVAAIYSIAHILTSHIYEAKQHDRERLHIAGVFANNFTNLMFRMAAEVLKGTQIPFEALLPLIDLTAAKVHTLAPKDAQTGPAKRGDMQVIAHHLEVLNELQDEEFFASDIQFTYMNMTQIIQTATKQKDAQMSVVDVLAQALEGLASKGQSRPAQARRRGRTPEL